MIEGSHDQVVALLDRQASRDGGVDKAEWREEIDGMYRLRREKG